MFILVAVLASGLIVLSGAARGQYPIIEHLRASELDESKRVIPAFNPPRKSYIPLQNPFGFSNVCQDGECGDFHLSIWYITRHSCAIRVRRNDDAQWQFDLSVYIQSVGAKPPGSHPSFKREVFYIGPSARHWKTIVVNSSIELFPDRYVGQRQLIPKTIVQTYVSRQTRSVYQWNAYQTFVELNPEYELKMFTDRESRQFVKQYMSARVLEAYDLLISPTFQADIFRYSYLAVHGGCYFDHKMIARLPMRRVIQSNDTLLVCSDANPATGLAANTWQETDRLYNAVICAQPDHPLMWRTIEVIVENIERRHSVGSDLSLTGPLAFYRAIHENISEQNVRFKHGVRMKSIMHMRRKYEDYYVREKITNQIFLTKFYKGFVADPKHRYGTLWKARTVFYDLLLRHDRWKVYVFPGQKNCVRPEFTESGSIVLRLHAMNALIEPHVQHGCQFVKVVVINDLTSEEFKLEIPIAEAAGTNQYTLQLPQSRAG